MKQPHFYISLCMSQRTKSRSGQLCKREISPALEDYSLMNILGEAVTPEPGILLDYLSDSFSIDNGIIIM